MAEKNWMQQMDADDLVGAGRKGSGQTPRDRESEDLGAGGSAAVDDVILRLLAAVEWTQQHSVNLHPHTVEMLIRTSRDIILSQPTLLELSTPVEVVGDVHGQYFDLLRAFNLCGWPPRSNYLFLGDYVDRGKFSVETICLVLAFKIKFPNNFFLLRGNHECAAITRIYGFYDDCKRRYDVKMWRLFTDLFNCLPYCAVIDDKIFCVHAGLSPELKAVEQLREISRPIDVSDHGLICDLLWGDPEDGLSGFGESDRGVSFTFGSDMVQKFLSQNGFDLIARAHQVVEDGFQFFANRQLVTLFSAPNYCGEFDNKAAVMSVDQNLQCTFMILPPQTWKPINVKGAQMRELRTLFVGLDGSGKTTMLRRIKLNKKPNVPAPTAGFNLEVVERKDCKFRIWDLSGKHTASWKHYYKDAQAVVFFVDASEKSRFHRSKVTLHAMFDNKEFTPRCLLILGNKQDRGNVADRAALEEALDTESLPSSLPWQVKLVSGMEGQGIGDCLEWLITHGVGEDGMGMDAADVHEMSAGEAASVMKAPIKWSAKLETDIEVLDEQLKKLHLVLDRFRVKLLAFQVSHLEEAQLKQCRKEFQWLMRFCSIHFAVKDEVQKVAQLPPTELASYRDQQRTFSSMCSKAAEAVERAMRGGQPLNVTPLFARIARHLSDRLAEHYASIRAWCTKTSVDMARREFTDLADELTMPTDL